MRWTLNPCGMRCGTWNLLSDVNDKRRDARERMGEMAMSCPLMLEITRIQCGSGPRPALGAAPWALGTAGSGGMDRCGWSSRAPPHRSGAQRAVAQPLACDGISRCVHACVHPTQLCSFTVERPAGDRAVTKQKVIHR